MSSVRLLCLLLLVATGTNALAGIGKFLRVGLQRIENGIFNFLFPTRGPTTTKTSINGLYVGTIEVGKGFKQRMKVLFDTSSSLMWLTSGLCVFTDNNAACRRNAKYNGWLSSSHRRLGTKFDYPYNSTGRVAGFLSSDAVTIGDMQVSEQIFGEATSVPTNSPAIDGVIGLGFSQAGPGLVSPLIYTMVNQALLPKPIFSLYHSQKSGGQLLLGEIDSSLFHGDLNYVNATGTTWGFMLSRIEVVGAPLLCRNMCRAEISTTTSKIDIPPKDLEALNQRIGAVVYKESLYKVNCSTVSQLPNITFVSNDSKFTLNSTDYIIKVSAKDEVCLTIFGSSEQEGTWRLGMPFLERFYTVFDLQNRRIGFAPSK